MSIDMFLDSADQQVDAISSQCRTYITGLEDVKTAIAQFALEDSLQGKTYDSAKNYLTTTFIPLANGIILICESLEKAAKSFPKSYRNEVDGISLQEEILRNQINRLTILAQNIENIENSLKATPLSPLLKHFSETLQNSKQEVQKQLVKLLSFDPVSGQLFIEVEGLIDNVERGLKEVNSGKSFNASTGTFSTMGLNMDWIKPINQQWEIYAESKEQLDTFEIKVTKTQYGTFYQVLRNGQVDDELSSAYQMAAIKSDIKTLLHLGGEFVLVNDIYRLVNGKDWLSGEEENRAEAAGWLTLSALPVSKLAQIAKELKAGNRALKDVALSEKDLEALSKAGVFKDTSGVGKKAKKASGVKEKIEIPKESLEHANLGDFTRNPKTGAISRMKGGGHGQDNIDFLRKNGIEVNIEKIYPNGVRAGNVPSHKTPSKRTGTGQSWFPENWTTKDIESAGQQVASLPEFVKAKDGEIIFGEVNRVRVGVIKTNGKIGTIFPDGTKQP
ncbi:hypothetical protein HCA57_05510 [Listeria welshimeri]|nr:hypothetical protein [Listeria welshimeri]